MRKDTGARTILIQHILREGIFLVHFFAHSNYHSHHTCSTIELAKACNDSQINQNLTTRRFWNVMSDLMPENGEPFSLNNSSSQFLCIWTSIQEPTTRTWRVVATWLVAEEGSIAAAHQSWELCFFFFFMTHYISTYFRSGQVLAVQQGAAALESRSGIRSIRSTQEKYN